MLFALWQEAFASIKSAEQTVATETTRAEDIANDDPDQSFDLIKKAELQIKRLSKAIPRLRERVEALDRRNYAKQWHAVADEVEAERDALATELRETYPDLVTQIANLFARIDANSVAIDSLHTQVPEGEARRLNDAELVARGLERYTAEQPRLRDSLLLPDFDRPRDVTYPPRFRLQGDGGVTG